MADMVEEDTSQSRDSPFHVADDDDDTTEVVAVAVRVHKAGQSFDSAIDMTGEDPKKLAVARNLLNSLRRRTQTNNTSNNDTKGTSQKDTGTIIATSLTVNGSSNNTINRSIDPLQKLHDLIWIAEYEAFQDPYRGIAFMEQAQKHVAELQITQQGQQDDKDDEVAEVSHPISSKTFTSINNRNKPITPWDACQFGVLSNTVTADKVAQALRQPQMAIEQYLQQDGSLTIDPNDPETLVRNLTEAQCPSLLAWTRQQLEEDAKKRATMKKKGRGKKRLRDQGHNNDGWKVRLGKRPSDHHYRCPCDYNPFCLGSMGGVVDDILKQRCENDVTVSILDEEEEVSGINTTNLVKRIRGSTLMQWAKSAVKLTNNNKTDGNDEKKNRNSEGVIELDESDDDGTTKFAIIGNKLTMDSISGETDRFKYAAKQGGNDDKNGDKDSSGSNGEILTCKRLKRLEKKPASGNPQDVYTQELGEQCLEDIQYSQATKEQLEKLRKSRHMKCERIKPRVRSMLKFMPREKQKTLEEYMDAIVEWHKSLLFVLPTAEERAAPEGHMNMALPPGIQNLGATCYLNTQLQCLAQNPVFLEGIFSWRAVDSSHGMNAVMSKLQKLLAQMIFGGDGKLSTLDFSNALGLEHYEQQDPNEFARLLFDRMEESFQQCSNGALEGESKEAGLSDLLKRIFHGTITYETTCMKCNKVSSRTEGFMDLNLPIVPPVRKPGRNDNTKKRHKPGTIEEGFATQRNGNCNKDKPSDTDAQMCLDQYLQAELLDGENQYFCETCKSKQDAKRVPKLTGLPPVLNVQLSRYVFDREKFVKKKLTDRVLLPMVLTLNPNDSSDQSKRYKLCAVMKHQGTSAYSGHYIAEARDWTTGEWYEFNDETVKVLITGPSCSFDPDWNDLGESSDSIDLSPNLPAGSQDAYNMYYVEEKYLAQRGLQTIERRQDFARKGLNGQATKSNVLVDVLKEREQKYSVLGEMCMFDWGVSDRLKRRKAGIRKYMFRDCASFVPTTYQENETQYWVEGKSLRLFLSCGPDLDEVLKSDDPIISPSSLLCAHGRLAPETAIQGKLLGERSYDAYVSLLTGERNLLHGNSLKVNVGSVVGIVLKVSDNIVCNECCEHAKASLTAKIEAVRNLTNLYSALQEEKNEKKSVRDSDCVYLITKSWATSFRKNFSSILKSVGSFDEGGCLDKLKDHANPILVGVADIDLTPFSGVDPAYRLHEERHMGQLSDICSLDETVNGKISCTHGNHIPVNKNVVRFVSFETWSKVKKAFPLAAEHKVPKEVGTMDVPKDGCPICEREKETMQRLKDDVERWVSKTRKSNGLVKLLDDKRVCNRDIGIHNFNAARCRSRLVYRDDVVNFQKAVKMANRVMKGDDISIAKEQLERIAFPPFHTIVYEFEKESVGKLLSSLRSLLCRAHKQVIYTAVFEQADEDINPRLSKYVTVLTEEEYNAYLASLINLWGVINGDVLYQISEDGEDRNGSKVLGELMNDLKTYHPSLESTEENTNDSHSVFALYSSDGDFKKFRLSPDAVCKCPTCLKEFAPLLETQKSEVDDNIENVSLESGSEGEGNTAAASHVRATIGGEATNPIIVESDGEASPNKLEVRVFEFKAGSTLQEAASKLREAAGQDMGQNEEKTGSLRRSSRKRKNVFPIGCIMKETKVTLGLHYNLAAVRLFLYERCEIPLSSHIFAAYIPSDANVMPCGIDLDQASNEDRLDVILKGMKKERASMDENHEDNVFLLHQRKEDETGVVEASLLDSLLEISNTELQDGEKDVKIGKRKRASERGFRGTLLQSSSSVGNDEDGGERKWKKVNDTKEYESSRKASVSDDGSAMELEPQQRRDNSPASDSSDEEPILKPNPKSSQLTSAMRTSSESSPQVLDVKDDNGVYDESHSTQKPISINSEDRFASILDAMKVADRGDERIDETRLADAVKWALAQPSSNNDDDCEIQSKAYCRYLEFQENAKYTGRKNTERAAEIESESHQIRVKEIFRALQSMFSENYKQEDLRLAAKRAVNKNPRGSVNDLQDAAISDLLGE
ncbi:ubiquitin carboxyl-terminal hydrolase [Nitzschia inconspicua]|uniref:ubiquitinyl hydrolase 1 n=1 Tax=Nitzschia inconspicua TaxID=303405 RepID=A0A9K3L0Z0_9STRA|nr:ubiquitin carboxyl-terminal hydrolase [Nitzschia inconspicua]